MATARFHLDTEPKVILECEDSGQRWNGWAVPRPKPSEVANFLVRLSKHVGDDEFEQMLPHFMEAYGGQDTELDQPITWMGFTWVKAHD